jgi:hypothetical protein
MATMLMMMLFSTSFNFSQCLHLPGANFLLQSTIRIVIYFIIVPLFLLTLMSFIKNIFVSWCKVNESVFLFAIKKMIECML